MKILVLAQDYPSEANRYAMNFVHTRNLEYKHNNLEVNVLSFDATSSYNYDGINILTEEEVVKNKLYSTSDIVISHAPNIRNHIRFLKKYIEKISHLVMFFHGHEVMNMNKYYPKPFSFMPSSKQNKYVQYIYDYFKLLTIKKFIIKLIKQNKIQMVFVSNWMRDICIENTGLDRQAVMKNSTVIPNSMNKVFLEKTYVPNQGKKGDFITIRPLDNPKYGVDIVVSLAEKHPHLTFDIYGKGNLFKYLDQPNNVRVYDEFLKPDELAEKLKGYSCAIMPTRLDAQGVMMCEIASYGMPVITSDLPICKEMLRDFPNVWFFNNEALDISLDNVLNEIDLVDDPQIKEKFSLKKTTLKEIELFNKLNKLT
ncbi:glycosyltransferase [Sutcliffiella horikoshii]|uniref:glycosyltransferase n=1 Tax=Sutcliffiella horikoshii TaxID=79883 RepID=UPI001F158D0E|nr:glycosyltransferase [Sutcliffiella horikoshii]MCG1021557.1 glycosyltransferase family 1 protein [Sutcliffiella horikoshii]